jgi:hypothetical protein
MAISSAVFKTVAHFFGIWGKRRPLCAFSNALHIKTTQSVILKKPYYFLELDRPMYMESPT